MKKYILSIIVLLGTLTVASAQNWNIEASLSYPFLDRAGYTDASGHINKQAEITSFEDSKTGRNAVILPTLSVSIGRYIENLPLSVRMNLYVNSAFNTLYGGPAPLSERETILHLMPELRVYYHRTENIGLYASVSAGLRTRIFRETLEGDTVGKTDFRFSWQVSPFGIEMGKRTYFNMTFGYGWSMGFIGMGVGYRF